MVQAGFEVFAYRNNVLFIERCNLGIQSFKGSATRQAFRKVPRSDCRSGLQKVRAMPDRRIGTKGRRDMECYCQFCLSRTGF
jgi:hypothetical protein